MSIPETLEAAIKIFEERNAQYGNNYEHFGVICKALFPHSLNLVTEKDFARFSNLMMIVSKLSRYCKNYHMGGHDDSIDDSIVYWAIQKELDRKEPKKSSMKERRGAFSYPCGVERRKPEQNKPDNTGDR